MSLLRKLQSLPALQPARTTTSLDDLRNKIASMVSESAVEKQALPTRRTASCPSYCTPQATPFGDAWVRMRHFGPAFRMGRTEVEPAARADMSLLALLALDPTLAGLDPKRALYLDTETTGLAGGAGTVAFLLGVGFFTDEAFVVEQVLLEDFGREEPLLASLRARIESAEFIVTFNGKSFDWPLLKTRFLMAKMPVPEALPHVDLLHIARRVHQRFGEPKRSMRLGALESSVLGFERVDDVPGSEVAQRYMHFLRSGNDETLEGVLEHNLWDVVSMAALLGLYGEPIHASRLEPESFEGLARTYRRAGALDSAMEAAELAVAATQESPGALHARAEIARARGERDVALRDLEALEKLVDSEQVRLELAKIYEHHVKDFARALAVAEKGTGEEHARAEKRRQRLEKKRGGQLAF